MCSDSWMWHGSKQPVVSFPRHLNQGLSSRHWLCSDAGGSVIAIISNPSSPLFFFSKKINILLFLWILVFSHSSSSVFYDDPGWGRRALLLQWRRELTLVAPYPPVNNLRALAGPEALRRDEGTSHDFLGGPETAPLSFRFVSKPPILVLILSLRRRGSLATSSFSPLQHWIVRSVRLLGKRSPFTLAMMIFGDAKAKESPRAVLENVNCGFGRVYFSILYEENVLFPKTEVIFLTNRCHK